MELNKGQSEVAAKVFDWLSSGSTSLFSASIQDYGLIIEGPAGTGKTFLLKHLVSSLKNVVLCAPTNKAVHVLQSLKTNVPTLTIYSLLGLRMEERQDTLVLVKAARSLVNRFRIVICDEASMLNEEVLNYIRPYMAQGIRFIFVGDRHQLNPIGEAESQIWDGYRTLYLTEQVRHDNQILKFVTSIRECANLDHLQFYNDHTRSEGVWCLPQAKFEAKLLKYARSGSFSSASKAVAWRNKVVGSLNTLIRNEIFPKEADTSRYLPKDLIVLTSPYKTLAGSDLYVDDEATVVSVTVGKHPKVDMKVYALNVLVYLQPHTIFVIHEDDELALNELLASMADSARAHKLGITWRMFWGMKNSFASVKYAYALTSHRAQGSTVRNAFVDSMDILSNSNEPEAQKSLYVACSRPTSKLFLL